MFTLILPLPFMLLTDLLPLKQNGRILSSRWPYFSRQITTSNLVHQGAKLHGPERINFWIGYGELEFNIYRLPVPDLVFFLDMPTEFSARLMVERNNKFTGNREKDIHERNKQFLGDSYENSLYFAQKYRWIPVSCVQRGQLRSIEAIHQEIYLTVKNFLKK
jgi:dTMP kinase